MSGTLIFRQFGIMLLEVVYFRIKISTIVGFGAEFLAASYLQKLLILACPLALQIFRLLFYMEYALPFLERSVLWQVTLWDMAR